MKSMMSLLVALAVVSALAAAAWATDWPQFQCNAAHTGWTPDSPAPPYEIAWVVSFAPEPIGIVQPIVYKGVLYLPTMQGRLYAIEPTTGKRLGVTEGLGTVMRTPAAGDGRIHLANVEGQVLAVKAGPGGPILWKRDLGFSVSAAPCLDAGRVYIGTRRGDFFCLDGRTGDIVWQVKLDGYVWSTAAFADGKVYVGTDGDMRMRCLDAKDGGQIWQSEKLPGMFMRTWCPVVTAGKVYVRTMLAEYRFAVPKPYETWGPKHEVFLGYFDDLRAGKLPVDFQKGNDELIAQLTKDPTLQTMFCFDAETGEPPFVVGAFHVLPMWLGSPPPPAVDSEGMLQVPVPYGLSRFGRMDPNTGRVIDIVVGPKLTGPKYGPTGEFARNPDGIGTNSDEGHASACGGDRVFWTHFGPFNCDTSLMFDIKTREVRSLPGNQYMGVGWRFPPATNISVSPTKPIRVSDPRAVQFEDYSQSAGYSAGAIWKNYYFKNSSKDGPMRLYAVRGAEQKDGSNGSQGGAQ